jgi:hypothetical protein
MRKLLIIITIVLVPVWGWAATNWFAGAGDTDFNAVSGGTTSSVWNTNADGTSGTYLDWATQPANGDLFIANGATIAIDANIGSPSVVVTLTTEGTNYGGTDGGGFTIDIGTNPGLTLFTNIGIYAAPEGTADILTITDAADAYDGTVTFGSVAVPITVAGGAALGIQGIADARLDAGGTVTIYGNCIGGGASASATGYLKTANSGNTVINGNCTGSAAPGCSTDSGAAVVIVNGNCIGAAATGMSAGCVGIASAAASFTVTGSIIDGTGGKGVNGKVYWVPESHLTSPSTQYNQVRRSATTTFTYYPNVGYGAWGF